MKEKVFNQIDEEVTKEFIDKINSLHELFHSPVFDIVNGFSKYTDSQGRSYMSKFQRNVLAFQRLYMALDSIRDIGFTSEYLNGSFELETTKANRQFIEHIFIRNLVFYNTQLIFSFINFLAYFFDMPEKDENISIYDCINYLYLVDEELCYKLESFLKSEEVNYFISVNGEIQFGFLGLAKITKQTRMENNKKGEFKVNRSLDVPSEKIKESTTKLLQNFYDTLTLLQKYMSENYTQSLGYDSPNDFIAEVSKEGFYKGATSDAINEARISEPIKIYNGVVDIPFWLKTDYFTLIRNRTFKDVKSGFYRATRKEISNIKMNREGTKVTRTVEDKQEGKLFWTHSLLLHNEVQIPLFDQGYVTEEVICLLLSLFTGCAIYSDKSKLYFSHKTQKLWHLYEYELANITNNGLKALEKKSSDDLEVIGLALSKYRETMQPMSDTNRLVRLWEIVDILSDHYCIDRKKQMPDGYDEKALRKKLNKEIKKIEQEMDFSLRDKGLLQIFTEKSIKLKIKDLIKTFKIASLLNVDETELIGKVESANSLRGILTHAGKDKTKDPQEEFAIFVGYLFFIQQLLFVILLGILKVEPKDTLKNLSKDISGFLDSGNYYHEKSEKLKEKMKNWDEIADILTGKKPFPEGKTKIEF